FQRSGKSADIANIYDLLRALDMLVQRDVKVVNLSLTGPANALLEKSVKSATESGMILVAAAGNHVVIGRRVNRLCVRAIIAG
ncbi:S8 family serine peptidase, partial [Rhizobium leguminosarum]|uniref:S8 family serine peptidase n=1 Tax=Rhizobium leguminosarum TaxID=384 RepID=UPI003F9AEBD2